MIEKDAHVIVALACSVFIWYGVRIGAVKHDNALVALCFIGGGAVCFRMLRNGK